MLVLQLKSKPVPRVSWTEDTIDNEGMNKKKSNRSYSIIQFAASTTDLVRNPVTLAPAMTMETPSNATATPSISIRKSVPNSGRKRRGASRAMEEDKVALLRRVSDTTMMEVHSMNHSHYSTIRFYKALFSLWAFFSRFSAILANRCC